MNIQMNHEIGNIFDSNTKWTNGWIEWIKWLDGNFLFEGNFSSKVLRKPRKCLPLIIKKI